MVKIITLLIISTFFLVGCKPYSASNEARFSTKFSNAEIRENDEFILFIEVNSKKNGELLLPIDKLCSLRFLIFKGEGKEGERTCLNAENERIKLSTSESFKFEIPGQLVKDGDGLRLQFTDDVYISILGDTLVRFFLEYEANFMEPENLVISDKLMQFELHNGKILIKEAASLKLRSSKSKGSDSID